jgi:cysteine dioxygenase
MLLGRSRVFTNQAAAMTLRLDQLLNALDGFAERIPLEDLLSRLSDLDLQLPDVAACLRFGESTYQRNPLRLGLAYHALVLCWRNGQRSPIHDHRGSSCAVRVLEGVATETQFERSANGLIYPTFSRELPAGSILGSQDADIHQMSNLQPAGANLVTLHVYSPPLLVMSKYSLIDPWVTEFIDPVHEFASGAGI